MAYKQIFTLKDIFNNKKLRGKLPLINYKEFEREDGKISVRTSPKSVGRIVYDSAITGARPFYNPLMHSKNGDFIEVGGTLVGDFDKAYESVYQSINTNKQIILWTANNVGMIRSALKESEKNKRQYGIEGKLWLRAGSMQEIENMSKPQLQQLLSDIMDNLYYNDNYPATQKKYGVQDMGLMKAPGRTALYDYKERKKIWENKVGIR